ncbi:hypothetical protein [Paenibacillus terrigena]|uniref:hypothetical protein n=1 Tax=Paenibacillus terrigena TaxID=369333 RepID=UPI000379DE9A|nr:hypothetical protein [Paenibacillus terrigena]
MDVQKYPDNCRNKENAFKVISLILIIASVGLVSSQIIGMTTGVAQSNKTYFGLWDHIYSSLNLISMFALLIGLVGIFLYQYDRLGKRGVISIGLAFFGTVLVAGDVWFEAFAVPFVAKVAPQVASANPGSSIIVGALLTFLSFSLGWIMVGVSSYKAGVIPKYICILIIIGGIFGFKALTIPYLGVMGIAIGILGVWMYNESTKYQSGGHIEEVSSIG